MIGSEDRTVRIDDEAGSQAPLALRPARHRAAEKTSPKIVERIVFTERTAEFLRPAPAFAHLRRGDIDDARPNFLGQVYEVRQSRNRPRIRLGSFAKHIDGAAGNEPVEASADPEPD